MKSVLVLLAVCLAMAVAMPQDNGSGTEGGGHGGGAEGGHHGRKPHPDCPDLKTLISGKCMDRTNRDCFKCVFDGCHPADTTTSPTCEEITTCVTANIAKC